MLLAFVAPGPAPAADTCGAARFDETARVQYVHDGDTVRLQDGRKVRLIGINTPELARDDRPEQAFAQEARDALKAAIAEDDHRVRLVYGAERQDRYKRTLAHLFTPDGDNLQARLLAQGMAAAIPHPPNLAFTDCYREQELTARCSNTGIWSKPAQFVVSASRLESKHKGFRLVSGTIDRISFNDHGVRIFMGKLMLGIHGDNRDHFDETQLKALRGKRVTVRGWLQPKRGRESGDDDTVQFYMHVRHPSAIEIDHPDGGAKC